MYFKLSTFLPSLFYYNYNVRLYKLFGSYLIASVIYFKFSELSPRLLLDNNN